MSIDTSAPGRPTTLSDREECLLVLLLCVAAGLRVLVFSLAFPFFNNVDEVAHVDLVLKYSQGHVPRKIEAMSPLTGRYITCYATTEYLSRAEQLVGGKVLPPVWTRPQWELDAYLQQSDSRWGKLANHESSQAPLYYSLAGFWVRLGQWCVSSDGALLYWIRSLNVLVMGILVWLSFVAARLIFRERRFLRLGVPALLAFFPQDAFYGVQNDVLVPLCFGVAFIGLVRLLRDDSIGWRVALMTGLALAATGLTKISSLPLLGAAAAAIIFRSWQLAKARKLKAALPALMLLAVSAVLPLAGLVCWNKAHYGDLTGSAVKIATLGWTRKPFAYWWLHPIFSAGGFWTFWSELTASFWRGETVWLARPLAWRPVDFFYSLSSALLAGAGMVSLLPRFKGATELQRPPLWFAVCLCVASVGFLVMLSLAFDFGDCVYPSRAHPYFVSGRLLSGVLVPFSLLYVLGLDRLFNCAKSEWVKWSALGAVVLVATVSEIVIDRPVFASQFNFFHMPANFDPHLIVNSEPQQPPTK